MARYLQIRDGNCERSAEEIKPTTPAEQWLDPTIGAKDVGEHGPQVLVLRQPIDHFCQAAGRHLEEEGQTFGEAGVDQELGHWGGQELQQSEEPNTPSYFLKIQRQSG